MEGTRQVYGGRMHARGFKVKGGEMYRLREQHGQRHRSLEGQGGDAGRDLGVSGRNEATRKGGPT